jgi:hypothetical protein
MSENASVSSEIRNPSLPVMPSACDVTRGVQAELLASDSVITEIPFSVAQQRALSLLDAAAEIAALAKSENDEVLRTALKAAELKKRIVEGEAGAGVKWMAWMTAHVRMSSSHLYALVSIGSSGHPQKALEDWRRYNRERSQDSRGSPTNLSKSSKLSKNHRLMLKLVRKLSDTEAKNEYTALWKRYRGRLERLPS